MYPIDELCKDLDGIQHTRDTMAIRSKSRDRFAISPLLRRALAGRMADIVVAPADKDELRRVVVAAVRHRVPITPRGSGTANYGQSVPLHGGILLDMTRMAGVLAVGDGSIRAQAGTLVGDIDEAARERGWELRIHPSTREDATIAGFVAGGSGGMGSCMWGLLGDRGNILGLEVMSVEEEPRIIELRGKDIQLVHHAYGANCLITEVEMPANAAVTWIEAVVSFADYMTAVRFGIRLAREVGIIKKLISLQEWPTPSLMKELASIVPGGHSMANCMVTSASFDAFSDLVAEFGGQIVSKAAEGKGPYGAPLYEFSFGHGVMQVQRSDPRYTALQGLFVSDDLFGMIDRVHSRFCQNRPMRMEILRRDGEIVGMGSPFIIFESEDQMASLVTGLRAEGVNVANNHASSVKGVGIKEITQRDVDFKRSMDPYNLLNPGKMDLTGAETAAPGADLPTDGWVRRKAV